MAQTQRVIQIRHATKDYNIIDLDSGYPQFTPLKSQYHEIRIVINPKDLKDGIEDLDGYTMLISAIGDKLLGEKWPQ